ncbi:MAG: hypothetical protein AAF495_16095 [Pseudomonadota bacterium]
MSRRTWVIGGIALLLALILGANGHLLYVAIHSQPDCAVEIGQAAKASC